MNEASNRGALAPRAEESVPQLWQNLADALNALESAGEEPYVAGRTEGGPKVFNGASGSHSTRVRLDEYGSGKWVAERRT